MFFGGMPHYSGRILPEAVGAIKHTSAVMCGVPVIVTNHARAELAPEAETAFVATKIAFINEHRSLCDRVEDDAGHRTEPDGGSPKPL
jgi:UDP-glucose 6-dehydrogenase